MTHVSLFTGIGGLDLAAEWAGFRTILQVEKDEKAQKVLAKHWPDTPRMGDIREVTSESVGEPVGVISGGFPCQPVSQAGQQLGTGDDRWLWPEMLRVIRELRPLYVVAENVSGLLSIESGMVFESVLSDLGAAGYETLPLHYPAAGVGAWHKRDRVFIVARDATPNPKRDTLWEERERKRARGTQEAQPRGLREDAPHANSQSEPSGALNEGQGQRELVQDAPLNGRGEGGAWESPASGADAPDATGKGRRSTRSTGKTLLEPEEEQRSAGRGGAMADADKPRPQGHGRLGERGDEWITWTGSEPLDSIWESEPPVGRVATGVPGRVDRLRQLGNAVVPQQAYPIFKAIAAML